MIGYFPEPFPDELLYSVIARYADRMCFPTHAGLMRMLFGRTHAVAIPDLPHGLAALVNNLPTGHPATVDTLIDSHSLLPYYGPFLQPKTYTEVRKAMEGSEDCSVRVRCGISTSRVRPPSHFRSCPICDAENQEKLGETFWNRIFQLKGVEVCIKHNVFLVHTNLRLSPLSNRHQFISANSSVLATVPTLIDLNDTSHQMLYGLAQDTAWLLQQQRLNPGLEIIHHRYLETLRARGFVTTKGGSIRMADLGREMEAFFKPKVLALLDSEIPDTSMAGWLGRLLHKPTTASAPLRHLLLMRFLQVTPQDFLCPNHLAAPDKQQRGPVTPCCCLNPVCQQFRKSVVTELSLDYIKKRKADAAVISCPTCRFTYGLYDWTKPAEKPDFVRNYGPLWLDRLQTLWLDSSVSVRHIGKVLQVDSKTVKSQASKLGLPFPRQGKRKATIRGVYKCNPGPSKYSAEEQRQAWLRLRRTNPEFGIKGIRRLAPALYTWLYRHDQKWLAANQPPRKKSKPARSRVDWEMRDQEIAGQVKTAALRIKNCSGMPVQVTATAIGRAIGRQSLLENRLDKLPFTRMVIRSVVESVEDFAVRRVTHVAGRLRTESGIFERWQLVKAAGLRPATEKLPKVQAALNYESIHALTA